MLVNSPEFSLTYIVWRCTMRSRDDNDVNGSERAVSFSYYDIDALELSNIWKRLSEPSL